MLPLFPLNTVLFPGCTLDLQLFEPRYLDMLTRCLKQGSGFGVVGLLAGQEVGAAATHCAELGCEALIRARDAQGQVAHALQACAGYVEAIALGRPELDLTNADGLFSAGAFLIEDRDVVLVTQSPLVNTSNAVRLFTSMFTGSKAVFNSVQ